YIPPEQAARVIQGVRNACGLLLPAMIGVFVDPAVEEVQRVRDIAGLDGVQFSGDEPPEVLAAVKPVRFRGLSLETLDRLGRYEAEAYLCDTHDPVQKGGTGRGYDYEALASPVTRYPIIVAGGLTLETVGGVVRRLRPWGVDVSSSVEIRPGRKDPGRVEGFIQAVREADRKGFREERA
ncbi:phosphoribosylanthranilate isomerase, partial [bacterium]|nr:phosphoribosylanthranilate isomerase [bacterium]